MKIRFYLFIYNLLSLVSCHTNSKRIIRWKLIAGSILLCINGHSKSPLLPDSGNLSLPKNDKIQNDSLNTDKNNRIVTGTIIDTNNEPLIGANILVKDTEISSISDLDGNFSLEVPSDTSKILISYIGYKPVELDIPQSPCTIILEEDESDISCYIVITGYCIRKEIIEVKSPKREIPFINKKDTTHLK